MKDEKPKHKGETSHESTPRNDESSGRSNESNDRGGETGEKRWLGDMMREMTLSGLATVFMTEDSIRNFLKEKKLPKELVSSFLDGVTKKKDDFYGLLTKEFGKVLSKVDVSREVGKFLERHDIHFEATVSFEPKDGEEEEP